jgi:hypothetical protein
MRARLTDWVKTNCFIQVADRLRAFFKLEVRFAEQEVGLGVLRLLFDGAGERLDGLLEFFL